MCHLLAFSTQICHSYQYHLAQFAFFNLTLHPTFVFCPLVVFSSLPFIYFCFIIFFSPRNRKQSFLLTLHDSYLLISVHNIFFFFFFFFCSFTCDALIILHTSVVSSRAARYPPPHSPSSFSSSSSFSFPSSTLGCNKAEFR